MKKVTVWAILMTISLVGSVAAQFPCDLTNKGENKFNVQPSLKPSPRSTPTPAPLPTPEPDPPERPDKDPPTPTPTPTPVPLPTPGIWGWCDTPGNIWSWFAMLA